jgi:hypothetical protein
MVMTKFRKTLVALSAVAMIGSQALAADVSALAPGKPAGVHQAQRSPNLLLIGGAAVVAVVAVVVATQGSNNNGACGTACNGPATTATST